MKAILKLCEGGGFFEKKNAQDSYQRQIEFSLFAYANHADAHAPSACMRLIYATIF